jgi:hypothetical protein
MAVTIGEIDVLVAPAAIQPPAAPQAKTSEQAFDPRGTWKLLQERASRLKAS